MEKVKLVVPLRRKENSTFKQLHNYNPELVEKIKIKDDVNRLNCIKELNNIDSDLKNLVKKIKVRKYIGLIYQITILKIHLTRLLGKVRSAKKARVLSFHMVQRHSHNKIDFHSSLVQNQNSSSKSPNIMDLKMLPRKPKDQYFHEGGVFTQEILPQMKIL